MILTRDICEGLSLERGRVASRFLPIALCFLVLSTLAASSAAIAGDLDQVILFDIQAQSLDKALLQFGAQAHVQISFAWSASTLKLRTHELKGNYTGKQALAILLKGTRFRYVAHDKTVEVLPTDLSVPSASTQTSSGRSALPNRLSKNTSTATASIDDPPARKKSANGQALQEVVITGSLLPTTFKYEPQEVQTYNRPQIDESGRNSVADFLGTLPSVAVSPQVPGLGVGTTVALRGLPIGTTLVLLNGRPLETSGVTYSQTGQDAFDLNNIPLAAVERIEVDENGASSVYGSDALAGVVNIILRRDFQGFYADARYGSAKDIGEKRASFAWGEQWRTGGYSVIGSYETDGGLTTAQRLLTSSNDYTSYGGPDNNYPDCFPGNVFSTNGMPLPGAPAGSNATYAAVTGATASGRPPLSQFTYGKLNACSLILGSSLAPQTRRGSLLIEGHMDITPSIDLFSELLYTHVRQETSAGYQDTLFGTSEFQEYTVSPSNPYNPFGATVGVTLALQQFPSTARDSTDFLRPLIGIKGTLGREWHWEASIFQSTDWSELIAPQEYPLAFGFSTVVQDALNSSDPATALNPFVDGQVVPRSLIPAILPPADTIHRKWMGRIRDAEAFIRGPVLRLPAGSALVVVGGDYIQDAFDLNLTFDGIDPPDTRLDFSRHNYALFGQVRIPLLNRASSSGSGSLLAATVAGRRDKYSDFGGATTEQYGLELRPADELLFRANYSTAFKAPSLPQLDYAVGEVPFVVVDPRTNTPEQVQDVYGGNPHLRAMTGTSHSIGVVYSGGRISGLMLSVTQWRVAENNVIQILAPQIIVDNASEFPGRVIRNSAGAIENVDTTQANFGSIDAAGFDYEAAYRHACVVGQCSIFVDATQTYHYTEALVPGAPPIDAISSAQDTNDWAPRWKGTATVGWRYGALNGAIVGRYTGSYQDYDSTRQIGNSWTFDANFRLAVGHSLRSERRWLEGTYIEVGSTNIANRAPRFSNYDFDLYGYDPAEASIVGRTVYVQAGVRW